MKARAAELIAMAHSSDEGVLGDDKAMRYELPKTSAQSKRERVNGGAERRQHDAAVDQELVRETSVSDQRVDDEDLLHNNNSEES